MQRRKDDLTFEGAWKNQVQEEAKEVAPAEKKEVKVHDAPAFRGQRDVVENRAEIRLPKKQQPVPEKKQVEVVSELSSKEGDDFDVEW
tara:strand:+ start:1053 stop:1316 length:264 start_codon:yes stop_codon:yes gene_type:complete